MVQPYERRGTDADYLQDSATESLWRHRAALPSGLPRTFEPLRQEIATDVLVVGGGITGVTTAFLLQKAGYDVVLLDAKAIGSGISSFNSGHLTTMLLDMEYRHIIAAFGEEATRTIARGLEDAIDWIERQVAHARIDCGFKRLPGYLYAEQAWQLDVLQEEFAAAARAGLPVNRTGHVPLPFWVAEGIMVGEQAVFDPLAYVQALMLQFEALGGQIYEQSRVLSITSPASREGMVAKTSQGLVNAREVVLATHTPIGFRPLIQTRLESLRSYMIGFRTEDRLGDAIFWDMDRPYHYLRMAHDEQGPLVLLGGEDHRTGVVADTMQCFQRLEAYARQRFKVQSVDYRWSGQLYNPVDGLPYVGKMSGVYVATGYSGEGLTFGTLAAHVIADQMRGIRNDCAEILDPSRSKPLASAGHFVSENLNAVTQFVKARIKKPDYPDIRDVPSGEGAICELDGNKVAVYHSDEGVFHLLSPVCTHMNCLVGWNPAEKSWDCPCHGGRFSATGQVLNGPPVLDLPPYEKGVFDE